MLLFYIFVVCFGVTTAQRFKFLDSRKAVLFSVRLGFSIIMDCETTDASATVTLWKNQKHKLRQVSSLDVVQSGQIFTLHNIALEDAGKYECNAQDLLGKKITKDFHVIINTFTQGLVLRPSINPVVVVTGSTVSFHCEAILGKIYWRLPKNMHQHPKPSKPNIKRTVNDSMSLSVLTIPNAQVANSGIYECYLQYYETVLNKNIYLDVKDPKRPVYKNGNSQPELIVLKRGHSKRLDCEVDGFPNPKISWEKDGVPIKLCTRIFFQTCQDHPYLSKPQGMKIMSARFPEDNGTYTCVAKNMAGVLRKDFQVVVEVKPALQKIHTVVMERSKIRCHATEGNPPPKFTWTMQLFYFLTNSPDESKWQSITDYSNTATTSLDGMTSTITPSKFITRAFYRCKAVNSAGQDTHTIRFLFSSRQ